MCRNVKGMFRDAVIAIISVVLLGVASAGSAADNRAEPADWTGEWTWHDADQFGMEYGGQLSIRDCDKQGCSYSLETGSIRSVCQSEGRFEFASPTLGVHELKEKDEKGNVVTCRITLARKNAAEIETDATGEGCSALCGASGNFGGDFKRISTETFYQTGFNCTAAKLLPLEKTICTNKALADLDLKLSNRYRDLVAALPEKKAKQLKLEQRQWIKDRNASCAGSPDAVRCLEAAYQKRLTALDTVVAENASAKDRALLPQELQDAGIRLGMLYATAKQVLLAAGWRVEQADADGSPRYSLFPEITCGEGRHALCSFEISKGSVSHALIVKETKEGLVIDGSY